MTPCCIELRTLGGLAITLLAGRSVLPGSHLRNLRILFIFEAPRGNQIRKEHPCCR